MIRRMLAALTLAAFTFSPLVGRAAETAVTHHTVEVDGKTLHYTATAGQIMVKDKAGAPLVNFFSVAYTLDDAPHGTRPVAFLWNGGPGSSTLWLHMGSFAPMRVPVDGTAPLVPPGKLVPNDGTLLASTDLVFIDAPGTGFSRLAPKAKADDVYGIDQDARAFTSFIEAWLTAHDRWGSPKFLIGESYGTTRAANVVDRLQEDGVGVNGVVLISSALALEQLDPAPPSLDNAYIAFLPTEAAVASYHGFGPSPKPPLASYLQEVRDFARGPYATALLRGDTLDAATRAQIVSRLHRYTGLSSAYIERADLRIDPTRFEKELQRGRGLVTGRLDGRFDGYDLDRNSDSPAYDPTLDATIQDAYVSEFNRYIRDDLAYKPDDSYRPTAYDTVGSKWKMIRDAGDVGLGGSYLPNVLPDLAQALTRNPSLRVFSANGYFDIATPFFGTEINLQHLGLDPALRGHITLGYYESGHMIYLEDASRRKLRGDIERFIASAIAH